MSSPSGAGADLDPETGPYQAILALVRRRQGETPEPDPDEADAAFRDLVDLTLQLFAEYARRHGSPPLPEHHSLTATDAALVSTHLLRAVDIALFELAMWQSWSGAGDVEAMRMDLERTRNAPGEKADG